MNFIFHHSGYDNTLPSLLVQSISKTNPNSTVVQVSDTQTRKVHGVTEHIQFKTTESILSKQRCEMYAKLDINEPAIYLDADMLVIKPVIEAEIFGLADVVLCQRYWDGMIYCEDTADRLYAFRNQSLKEVWPYLACFVASRTSEFWKDVQAVVQTLPWEKSDWFADQHALKILRNNTGSVSEQQYGCLPDQEDSYIDQASILHFKGSRKTVMEQYYHNILC